MLEASEWLAFHSTNCSISRLKTDPLQSNIKFFKCYFKNSIICLLFWFLHVFTALEFDSNYFGILIVKVVELRDHNEIKPTIWKSFQK